MKNKVDKNIPLPKTAILITAYNKATILDQCLSSIDQSDHKGLFDVFVSDNGSVEDIESIAKKHKTHFTLREKNQFVSRALNELFFDQNIVKKYKYVIFMGNDVQVNKRTFIEMVKFMEDHPEVGVTGPVLCDWRSLQLVGGGLTIHPVTSLLNQMNETNSPPVNHFLSMYLIRSEAFHRVNGFNHVLFPMIYEEPDVGERIRRLGYEIRLTEKASIVHPIEPDIKPGSHQAFVPEKERLYNNKPKAYLFFRNRIIYMSLYSPIWGFIVFLLIFNPLIFLYYLKSMNPEHRKYAVIGMWDGLRFALTKSEHFIEKRNREVLAI
jgi:GT2 family glycosyltransferase